MPGLLLFALVAAQGPATPPPSVAIFTLKTTTGVNPEIGLVLTNQAVVYTRQHSTFARVSSSADVEALLGLERQKQLLDCDTTGCMAEIAGSLNVSHILTGTVSRLGAVVVLTLNLVAVQSQHISASVTRHIKEGNAEKLLDVLPGALDELFRLGGAARPPESTGGLWPKALLATGGVTAVAGVVALVAGLLGAGGAATFLGALYGVVPINVRGMVFGARMVVLGGLGAGAAVMLLASAVTGLAAVGALAGGALGLVRE